MLRGPRRSYITLSFTSHFTPNSYLHIRFRLCSWLVVSVSSDQASFPSITASIIQTNSNRCSSLLSLRFQLSINQFHVYEIFSRWTRSVITISPSFNFSSFLCFWWIFSAIYTIIFYLHGLIVFLFLPVEIHGEIHWWIRVMMKRFDYTCMCPCCLQQNRKKGSHHLLLNSSSTYFQIFLSWLFQFQCSMFFNDSIGISHDEFQDLICLSICTGSVLGFS